MKTLKIGICSLLLTGAVTAEGLYYVGTETLESLPLKWSVGVNLIYDDNVAPSTLRAKESAFSVNPYVGVSFVNVTPQTTWDVYARLGLIYYFDNPQGTEDVHGQSRVGVNLTHRFSERLRFSSRNFISYELEPDYSYAYANTRSIKEYFFWQTDNSLGYRWSERFATYTGFQLSGLDYQDVRDNDRFTWMVYTQGRYQLSPQTVLTAEYRYSQTTGNGVSSDSTNQYLLGGVEHRFSPNTIGILRVGAQFRDVDNGDNSTSPYLEFALNSQINQQFRVRAFARYGLESYDTVQTLFLPAMTRVEYDQRKTLRIGVNGEYALSPMLSIFGGVDYIPSTYEDGRRVDGSVGPVPDSDEDVINAHIGLSVKFNDYLYGSLSYSHTNSSSDLRGRDYDRNRVSVGVRAEF
jgi:hypothetical protein